MINGITAILDAEDIDCIKNKSLDTPDAIIQPEDQQLVADILKR
jgi:hypothetical protein